MNASHAHIADELGGDAVSLQHGLAFFCWRQIACAGSGNDDLFGGSPSSELRQRIPEDQTLSRFSAGARFQSRCCLGFVWSAQQNRAGRAV